MPVQKFRARMKRQKYDPETDPEMVDEYGEYFAKAADEEQEEGKMLSSAPRFAERETLLLSLDAKSSWLPPSTYEVLKHQCH